MVELSRTVRFCLNGPGQPRAERRNGYAAWPAMRGLGRFYQLQVRCVGQADPLTGYFMNIKRIDSAVREHVLPTLEDVIAHTPHAAEVPMGRLMRRIIELLQPPLDRSVSNVRLDLTPFYSLAIRNRDMDHVIIREQYEFAAAHRLHVESLSADENRRIFGKCNNPSGHGHNYVLEVAVRVPIDPQGRTLLVEDLDRLVDEVVIQRLDHKHLNLDVHAFASLNPSVENIAKVIYAMLHARMGDLGRRVALDEVRVWETGKTVCTYRGEDTGADPDPTPVRTACREDA